MDDFDLSDLPEEYIERDVSMEESSEGQLADTRRFFLSVNLPEEEEELDVSGHSSVDSAASLIDLIPKEAATAEMKRQLALFSLYRSKPAFVRQLSLSLRKTELLCAFATVSAFYWLAEQPLLKATALSCFLYSSPERRDVPHVLMWSLAAFDVLAWPTDWPPLVPPMPLWLDRHPSGRVLQRLVRVVRTRRGNSAAITVVLLSLLKALQLPVRLVLSCSPFTTASAKSVRADVARNFETWQRKLGRHSALLPKLPKLSYGPQPLWLQRYFWNGTPPAGPQPLLLSAAPVLYLEVYVGSRWTSFDVGTGAVMENGWTPLMDSNVVKLHYPLQSVGKPFSLWDVDSGDSDSEGSPASEAPAVVIPGVLTDKHTPQTLFCEKGGRFGDSFPEKAPLTSYEVQEEADRFSQCFTKYRKPPFVHFLAVARGDNGIYRDVTRRYAGSWQAVLKVRTGPLHLYIESLISLCSALFQVHDDRLDYARALDRLDEFALHQFSARDPLPTSASLMRSHHLYATEGLLKANEVIIPKEPVLGWFKGEPVYPRRNVWLARSPSQWRGQGRDVQKDQIPVFVRFRTLRGERQAVPYFVEWQTRPSDAVLDSSRWVNLVGKRPTPAGMTCLDEVDFPGLFSMEFLKRTPHRVAFKSFSFQKGRLNPVKSSVLLSNEHVELVKAQHAIFYDHLRRKLHAKYNDRMKALLKSLCRALVSRRGLIADRQLNSLSLESAKKRRRQETQDRLQGYMNEQEGEFKKIGIDPQSFQ
ncbi:MAG: uncharacterized protein KVP18_003917 [Porospora cf. gigantea A]|uniref:uncharacterized protein n=1 Tax=Porospora cf. gigantea A TaxID=2853593 RepID=UPI003559E282|nr:MAG: hypothetical protein KVP18_003917 [Porospora cf. gigantea A]